MNRRLLSRGQFLWVLAAAAGGCAAPAATPTPPAAKPVAAPAATAPAPAAAAATATSAPAATAAKPAAAATTAPATAGGAGRQLIVAAPATPVTLDGEYAASIESWEVAATVYEYLTAYQIKKSQDGTGVADLNAPPEGRLAEKWEFSPDGKVLTFYLRKGVKSEWGNELTANDVKWSWDRAFGLNAGGMWMMKACSIPSADAIKVVDPYTIQISLSGSNGLLPVFQTTSQAPAIFDSTEVKKHVTASDPWAKDWLAKNTATFGPYKVSKFTPGQEVIYDANPNYYRDKPKIAQVVYKEVPSSATRLQLLQSGSVHIAKELDARERQQLDGKPGVQILSSKANEGCMFGMNTQVKPLDNVKVRQAIAYACPVDDIIKTVYLGNPNVRLLKGFTPESYPAYTDYFPYYPGNLDKAQALLKEAGQGPFAVKLALNASRPDHEQVAILLQTQLKKIGVDLQIDKMTAAKYQEQYFSRKAETVLVQDAAWVSDPAYSLSLYFGGGTASVGNWVNYENKEVIKLLGDAFNSADAGTRKELSQKAHKLIIDDAPWGFYIGTGYYVPASDKVTGFNWRSNNLLQFADWSFK
jgi:peptide/nickel transport system substrate-binding protein